MNILLGYFNAKVGIDKIFNPTIGNDSLHKDNNDNRVRTVTLPHKKNLAVKEYDAPALKHS
jgi:hypothetical protein